VVYTEHEELKKITGKKIIDQRYCSTVEKSTMPDDRYSRE